MFARIICAFLFSALAVSSIFAQSEKQSVQEFVSILEANIPAWQEEFIVPGAVVALIEDGEVIVQQGYGLADIEANEKVSITTGFNIASISKTVAAWGVMKLVEEGKLELDAPASKYLTRWQLPESEFDASKVTISRLLSHTAGLSLHGYPGWTPADVLPTIEESLSGKNNGPGDVRLILEPGTEWKYSGGGYTMLQLIIEEVTGQLFEDYMQEAVLNPLGMTNSSYKIDDKIMAQASLEYNNMGKKIPYEVFTAKAAAGLYTTIEDFTKFAQHNLKEEDTPVLKRSTILAMMEPSAESPGYYGLGYGVEVNEKGGFTLAGHGGANTGWRAQYKTNQETKDAFIVFTNSGSGSGLIDQVQCSWVQWAYDYRDDGYCRKSIVPSMINLIEGKNVAAAIAHYKTKKASEPQNYYFQESAMNNLGYGLIGQERLADAIAIFKLNTEEYPKAFNVWDSLGEGYMLNGDKKLALKYYKKSLKLNPQNSNAVDMMKKIKEGK